MTTGKDDKLADELSTTLFSKLNGSELVALTKLETKDVEMLSESAGQVAIELLMGGRANNSQDVDTIMKTTCLSISTMQIIKNQKRANQATQANLGK